MPCRKKSGQDRKERKPRDYKKAKIDLKKVTVDDMRAIPETEDDLIQAPVYINRIKKVVVDEMMNSSEIKEHCLAWIYIGDEQEAIQAINQLQRENEWVGVFQFDLLAAFWLSIHFKRGKVLNHCIQFDVYLRQLVTLALSDKEEKPKEFKMDPKVNNNRPNFDKAAGLNRSNRHLAGVITKKQQLKLKKQASVVSDSNPKDFPNQAKINVQAMSETQNQNFMPELDFPPQAQGIALSPKEEKISERFRQGGAILSQGNFEGGSFEGDDGQFEEFDEHQNIALDERIDPDQAQVSDEDDDDDDDFGEGEGESDKEEKSMSGGSRSSIKEFQSHMIGGYNYENLDCTTPMVSGLSNLGINAQENDYDRPPRVVMDAEQEKEYLREQGITGQDVELMSVETDEELERLKTKLRFKFPSLMANIALILLHKKEELLACFLTAYYELGLEESTILYAIDKGYFKWLDYVWAFGKNYIGRRSYDSQQKVIVKKLMQNIKDIHVQQNRKEKDLVKSCEAVCCWYLHHQLNEDGQPMDDHNMLWALLSIQQNKLAVTYMGFYANFLKEGLFVYALHNNNAEFMREALQMQAFDKGMYSNMQVVRAMLTFFENDGSKTNFILNVILLTDISQWKTNLLDKLLELFASYTEEESKVLLLSYNPLMTIALTCDLLVKIGQAKKVFRDQCAEQLEELLSLGGIYSGKVDDLDEYKNLVDDLDFNGRTVLNIICYLGFQELLSEDDPKGGTVIRNIWHGENFTRCDGSIMGYSNISHILFNRAKRAAETATFMEIVSGKFEMNLSVDYTFQYAYRSEAVSEYFLKEIVMAAIMVGIYTTINGDYQSMFKGPLVYVESELLPNGERNITVTESSGSYDFNTFTPTHQITDPVLREEMLAKNLEDFAGYYPMVLFLCGSLCYSVVMKLLFNMTLKAGAGRNERVPIDVWTKFDLVSAVATIVGFNILLRMQPIDYMTKDVKDLLDYMMLAVIILQWVRFYSLFVMISELSKMILTFFSMVVDTIAFMFLVFSYLIVSAAIFTTLFQDMRPDIYGTFVKTIISMFDGLMGGYTYKGFGDRELLHMVAIILHVWVANILLLNYLIAILSESYSVMLDQSSFLFKVYLYKYCERYVVGFENNAYGQLIIHPAPIVVLNFPLAVLSLLPQKLTAEIMPPISKGFSMMVFWLENIIHLGVLLAYESFLMPFVYFKNIMITAWATQGLFTTIFYTAAWIFVGPIILVYFILSDVGRMFQLMTYHDGCKIVQGTLDDYDEDKVDEEDLMRCFNEARNVVISVYLDIIKDFSNNYPDGFEPNIETFDVLQTLADDADEIEENRQSFVQRASTLTDLWLKEEKEKRRIEEDKIKNEMAGKKQEQDAAKIEEQKRQEQEKKQIGNKSKSGKLKNSYIESKGGRSEKIAEIYIEQVVDNEQNDDQEEEQQEEQKEEEEAEADDDPSLAPGKDLEGIVEGFYNMFIINAESSATNDQVDITLLLKAIPTKISTDTALEDTRKFKFLTMDNATIAKSNSNQVTSFEYYDKKNKTRVSQVQDHVRDQRQKLEKISETIGNVKRVLQENSGFLNEYEEMAKKWEEDKKRIQQDAADKVAERAVAAAPEDGQGGGKAAKGAKGKNKRKK